jgi:hypothetical protein
MTLFFNQMLTCLLIAAGIGGVIGWLLKHVSAGKLAQQLADVTAMMRLKEQMLEKARHQLRDAASASKTQLGESEMMASQTVSHFNQENPPSQARFVGSEHHHIDTDRLHTRRQESEAAGGWIEWLDVQLTQRDEKHRIALDEVMLQLAERDQRIREFEQLQKQSEALEDFPTDKAA